MLTFDLCSHMLPFVPKFDSTEPDVLYSAVWVLGAKTLWGYFAVKKLKHSLFSIFPFHALKKE